MKATMPSRLRTEFVRTYGNEPSFEIRARMPSEIEAISPLADRIIRLIEESRCVIGDEPAVGLALREALNNAQVLHGNRLDSAKFVEVNCRCEAGGGVSMVIRDQGGGFDPTAISDPSISANLEAEHGRGILLMRWVMDEVSFEFGFRGTEVRMSKRRAGVTHGAEK